MANKTVVKRNYYNERGDWANYRNCLHDHEDNYLNTHRVLDELFADVQDGDEVKIIVHKTGNRPFGDRRYRYQSPHTYGPETDEQLNTRLKESREKLKADALELVNAVYLAFDREPLRFFIPTIASEDTDCVIQAIEAASNLTLYWGEQDTEGRQWIGAWGETPEIKERCDKLAKAWGTTQRIDNGNFEIEAPAILTELACRVAFEGEYPELVKE